MDRIDLLMRTLTRLDGLTGEAYEKRYRGLDWPTDAETMIGMERLQNVRTLAEDVIKRGIPGDFMECGVWKGGCCILMAAILARANYCIGDPKQLRRLYVADSFQGCPVPDARFSADAHDQHSTFEFLRVSLSDVQDNFKKYGLLNIFTMFLPGWFKDTLPGPVQQLALLRIDADMYESTTQVLEALYDKVTPGGYVVCDDYHNIPNCRQAIIDFRAKRGIVEPIQSVDWCAVYWQKNPVERQKEEAA